MQGVGCMVWGLGFMVSGFRLWVSGVRASGSRFHASGFGCRVSSFKFQVSGFRVSGFGFRVSGFGSQGFRFRVSGFRVGVSGHRVSGCVTLSTASRKPTEHPPSETAASVVNSADNPICPRVSGFGMRVCPFRKESDKRVYDHQPSERDRMIFSIVLIRTTRRVVNSADNPTCFRVTFKYFPLIDLQTNCSKNGVTAPRARK